MISSQCVRIAVLDADVPVPAVRSVRGLYSDIFADLLQSATKTSDIRSTAAFAFQGYDVVGGRYPPDLEAVDGLLITGSSASAYDEQPWIAKLNSFIQQVYTNHPHIRVFGSCFGHQIICQALLGPYGAHVTKDPKGWELGVHPVKLTEPFREHVNLARGVKLGEVPAELRFQFIHADHVVIPPTSLPPDWMIVGSSEHCAVQGVFQPDRVLTYQGHFEFDRFINAETVKVFGVAWDDGIREAALRSIDEDDDAGAAAEIAARFLLGESEEKSSLQVSGLLTPPEDV